MLRILVTGSRNWTNQITLVGAITIYVEKNGRNERPIIVTGACPTGADRLAEELARFRGWDVELHPAAWERYGKAAGFRRNAEMVKLGADVCFAFIKDNSRGATHTAELAKAAGISTLVFRA